MPESTRTDALPSAAGKTSGGILFRMAHGIGAGIIATILSIAGNLLLLPLYLSHWSVTVYGEWMALYSVVSYIGALDFGLTTAATNAAAHAFAGQRWSEFKRIQGTAWALSLGLALAGALLCFSATTLLSVKSWLRIKVMKPHESSLVIAGLAVAFLITIPSRQLSATYIALGNFAKYQWIYNAGQILTLLSIGIGLRLGATPADLAIVVAASTLIMFLVTYGLIWHSDAELVPSLRHASVNTARSLARPSGEFLLQMGANLLILQGPVVVISRAFGGQGVAVFTTTRTVSNVVKGILTIFRAPLRPEYAVAYAQPTKDKLQSLFRTVVAIDTTVAVTLTAGLWSGGVILIRLWSHHQIGPDLLLLRLLLLLSLLEGLLWMMTSAGNAANRFHGVSWGALMYALSSVLLASLCVSRFGISAVPASAIVCLLLFMLPFAFRNARFELETPQRSLITRVCIPFVVAAGVSIGVAYAISSYHGIKEWTGSALSLLLTCVVSLVPTAGIMMTSVDRRKMLKRLAAKNYTGGNDTELREEHDRSYV